MPLPDVMTDRHNMKIRTMAVCLLTASYGMGYSAVIAGVRADQNLAVDTFINTSYQWIDSSNLNNEEYSGYLYG